ncbi:MAG: LON peptidase substrate-binding domain-containing protein [Verrucomicrobiota bacterium]|nr:LON peptidase substrate-binding domain-containing protein [Verrucomicrobiota bacterium]
MKIQEIEIPREVPVMTMSQTVLFPQAIMPLFIFEPRYREMLRDVLNKERIFAVAALDEEKKDAQALETPYPVAGVGVIRACKQNEDGTSNLILQGLARVKFDQIICEDPYRRARIQQLFSVSDGSEKTRDAIKSTILAHLQTQVRLGADIPLEVLQFLSKIEEVENMLDMAIYTLCPPGRFKQELLETCGILERFEKFQRVLRSQIERLKINYKLKGGLNDSDIGDN